MANLKAKMFNRKAGKPKNKPDEVINALALKPGQCIADIGSGGGYFSLRFAKIVGEGGKVYAVDTNKEFLDFIEQNAIETGLKNVIPVLTKDDAMDLPAHGIDLVFMRNVTHHLPNRQAYFKNLAEFLTPRGRVAIIEYKKRKSFSFHALFGHDVPKDVIQQEMEASGYTLEQEFDFLPEQHFSIYLRR
jgi:arsenite methyltransferase